MRFLISIFLLSIHFGCYTSCSHPKITGQWKTYNVTFYNREGAPVTMNFTYPEKLKKELYLLVKEESEISEFDSVFVTDEIENTVSTFMQTGLILEKTNTYEVHDFNMLLSIPIPGMHLSDTVYGKWTRENDTLILSTIPILNNLEWKFKIVHLTSNELKIQEISRGTTGKEILFKRQ